MAQITSIHSLIIGSLLTEKTDYAAESLTPPLSEQTKCQDYCLDRISAIMTLKV